MDVKKERNTGEIAHQAALLLWPGYDLGTCIASACSGYEWTLGAVGVIPGGKLAVTGVKLLGWAWRAWRAKRIAANGRSVGAMRRNTFEASPKHGTSARSTSKGVASRGPTDGQHALDVSVQVRGTSPTRPGVDKANGEIVVFNRTSEGIFHGHVRSFGELNNRMKSALVKSGMVDRKGSFK